MPVYTYKCKNILCKREIDKTRKVEDREKVFECEFCHSAEMIKVVSLSSPASFKGGGWTPRTLARK